MPTRLLPSAMTTPTRREFGRMMLATGAVSALGMTASRSTKAAGRPLNVVATTGMIADAVRQIGGDDVTIRALMGPGIDPHAYRQTRTDIAALVGADLVLWHGLFLEAQMEAFLTRLSGQNRVVPVAEKIDRARLMAHESYDDQVDPHVWMDPGLWIEVVQATRDALTEARPDRREAFASRTDDYVREIGHLDTYARKTLATVPTSQRVLVTAHDAFSYFGRAYDFEVVGIQGISTASEAGLRRIADVVSILVERSIGAVFVETSVSDRNVRALVEGAAARGWNVEIGGELYSDAMGSVDTYEGTYLGMIDHNVTTVARALGGSAPVRGMSGNLATADTEGRFR